MTVGNYLIVGLVAMWAAAGPSIARAETVAGPLNGQFIAEGIYGVKHPLEKIPVLKADADWTFNFWIYPEGQVRGKTLLAGFGDGKNTRGEQRYLASFEDGIRFWGGSVDLVSKEHLESGKWQMLTVVYGEGNLRLYLDGRQLAAGSITLAEAKPEINLGPLSPWNDGGHFGGKIALFTLWDKALSTAEIQAFSRDAGRLDQQVFLEGKPKPWDPKANITSLGTKQQKPEDLPVSKAAPQKPGVPKPATTQTLVADSGGGFILAGPWKLIEGPKVTAKGPALSTPGFADESWYSATVPGTVLTTLVDQGIYPNPFFGLNNLVIPETLNKQDYWYRLEFVAPQDFSGRNSSLTFNGINYAAEIWLNGRQLGSIQGAFIRGIYDLSALLKPGQKNALAVRVSPPPNPGLISHEQSPRAGAGPNGGSMCLDGPTFFCSEGWDWIPGIRDRNTGIWQDVVLKATGAVVIGDPHVVTRIPEPVGSRADVTLEIELKNITDMTQSGVLRAVFEGVVLEKKVTLGAKAVETIRLTPAEFPSLAVMKPRLWWPNGYGKPELYHLALSFEGADGRLSDTKKLKFGMREVSVVLTALSDKQTEVRCEFFPAAAREIEVVKHDHGSLVESRMGWVPTLAGDLQKLPGIRISEDTGTERFLEIRVNGVRIPARGGNWGMDEGMKRVSRERLEPYIRLQRDANFNILRNWCGQSTEEVLFDLCDEYGIMVLNEFWISTQWANVEPRDADLFLANASDTLKRFRTHPSIVLWCGRNEGVPPEAINVGLDERIRKLDGTRYYQPASVTINLAGSGPWKYIPPAEYFGKIGFTTELGLPSPLTEDSIRAMMPKEDLWPISDTWGYHDWLGRGAMDVKTFMAALDQQYGEPDSFEDFVRKAQMINYVSYRAMYEALNANLWKPSTGTLLWMSHASWPSMVWQIYGSDYQPNASFYGVKKGCEPVHVQMNLPDSLVLIANTTLNPISGAKVVARVYDLEGKLLSSQDAVVEVPVNGTVSSFVVNPEAKNGVNFVKLELRDKEAKLLSENFYWRAPHPENLKVLNQMPRVKVEAVASGQKEGDAVVVKVQLENKSQTVALMTFLTLRTAGDGRRVLPAYADLNYVNLLPGEKSLVTFEAPAVSATAPLSVSLEGWNIEKQTLAVPFIP